MSGGRTDRDAAYRTLLEGTRFMSDLAGHPRSALPWSQDRSDLARARYLANCLRELDRFLHVLMDETAPALTVPAATGQRCAARKIDALLIDQADGASEPEQDRLRALGRTRACLWHCHGRVRRPDRRGGAWMTAGWREAGTAVLQRYSLGDRLAPAPAELSDVGAFYRLLGDRLIAAI